MPDTDDLAAALTELGLTDAADRVREKGMPHTINCNAQYEQAYGDKLKMYAKVKANWLIKDSSVVLSWQA